MSVATEHATPAIWERSPILLSKSRRFPATHVGSRKFQDSLNQSIVLRTSQIGYVETLCGVERCLSNG